MQIALRVGISAGMGSEIAQVETSTTMSEISTTYKREELLPADLDAMNERLAEGLEEIAAKMRSEIERLRPAALALQERLAHEEAAKPS